MHLTVVILTCNEELHIERAISSVKDFASHILVVDSGSTDHTIELAEAAGAIVLRNPWQNYATQMNWAFARVPKNTEWIMRLDADEVVSKELSTEVLERMPMLSDEIAGVYVARRMKFMGGEIRRGGLFPIRVLRFVRYKRGFCESRWMDEHLICDGPTIDFSGELVDDNLKPLSWWVEKHNSYASREVVDLLNLEFGFFPHETIGSLGTGKQDHFKRWIKEKVYARIPLGLRAGAYFFYRFFIRFGFLDTIEGRRFHVLQGFWYRYLVDVKLQEVRTEMDREGVNVVAAIKRVLGIDLSAAKNHDA